MLRNGLFDASWWNMPWELFGSCPDSCPYWPTMFGLVPNVHSMSTMMVRWLIPSRQTEGAVNAARIDGTLRSGEGEVGPVKELVVSVSMSRIADAAHDEV